MHQLDANPQPLIDFLGKLRLRRLGFYHEALWHFFLQQDDEIELIVANCQVQQANQTIGEFDVIYRDLLNDRVVHLELAFKLYLLAPQQLASDTSHWLGPNLNDRLDLKLDHMLNHQCRLALTEAGQETLRRLNIEDVTREISLRGYLVYAGDNAEAFGTTGILNQNHRSGEWLPLTKAIQLLGQYQTWAPLTNLQWISPVDSSSIEQFKAADFADYLQQHFEQRQSPLMVSASNPGRNGNATESYRLMVTPDSWPQRSVASNTQ